MSVHVRSVAAIGSILLCSAACRSSGESAGVCDVPAGSAPGPAGQQAHPDGDDEAARARGTPAALALPEETGACVCGQQDCESPGPGEPPPVPPGAAERIPAPPTVPTPPAELPPARPLPPGLAAHLERIPDDAQATVVVQADVGAILEPDAMRVLASSALSAVPGGFPGDPACLAELAASVRLATYAWLERDDGPDAGIVIVDGAADLPGIVECMQRVAPELLPPDAAGSATRGFLTLQEEHIAVAALGPHVVALGSEDLVSAARSGEVSRPLSRSSRFEAARGAAGSGPVFFAVLVDQDAPDVHGSIAGGIGLRTAPRLGVSGGFEFGGIEDAGEALGEVVEALAEIGGHRAEILADLRGSGMPEAAQADVAALLDAAAGARITLQGSALSFEAWLPEGTPAARAIKSLVQLWLVIGDM